MGHPLTITITADELIEGDYIADEGVVTMLSLLPNRNSTTPYVCAWLGMDSKLLLPTDKVVVHLEDSGDETS